MCYMCGHWCITTMYNYFHAMSMLCIVNDVMLNDKQMTIWQINDVYDYLAFSVKF